METLETPSIASKTFWVCLTMGLNNSTSELFISITKRTTPSLTSKARIKSLEIRLDPPGSSIEDKQSETFFCNEFINCTPNRRSLTISCSN